MSEADIPFKKGERHEKAENMFILDESPKFVKLKAKTSSPKARPLEAVVGSGASKHVVGSHKLLKCVQKKKPVSLYLANDITVTAFYTAAYKIEV